MSEGRKERLDECYKKASEMVFALNLAYVFEHVDLEKDLNSFVRFKVAANVEKLHSCH